jgi:hypothetical protein
MSTGASFLSLCTDIGMKLILPSSVLTALRCTFRKVSNFLENARQSLTPAPLLHTATFERSSKGAFSHLPRTAFTYLPLSPSTAATSASSPSSSAPSPPPPNATLAPSSLPTFPHPTHFSSSPPTSATGAPGSATRTTNLPLPRTSLTDVH